MFNSHNTHIVTRFHHQLVEAVANNQITPKDGLDRMLAFDNEEHRTENLIHDQAVFSQDTAEAFAERYEAMFGEEPLH